MNARRDFLKKLSLAAGAGVGVGAGLYSLNSFSAGLTGYKALVVIHLSGGNDANDMLVGIIARRDVLRAYLAAGRAGS
mgnify:CR=1 FL=1